MAGAWNAVKRHLEAYWRIFMNFLEPSINFVKEWHTTNCVEESSSSWKSGISSESKNFRSFMETED